MLLAGASGVAAEKTTHATWRGAMVLIVLVAIGRLVYSIWLSPVQLAGDEAYYWQQARHLDLCYNEKGPALAWMIAPCCWLFGDREWAVRLPVLISFAISAWAIGRLTLSIARGNQRAAFFSVALFCLIPAFEANAQICTQDGPIIAIWIALTAIGLRLFRRWREGANTWPEWMLLWFVVGIGFLFKQSILLFLPGVAIYWLMQRRELPMRFSFFIQQIVGMLIFGVLISPMIVWNTRHGWPMLAHTLGHLGAGGDQATVVNKGNAFYWVGATLGGIAGSFGPACLLMWWASKKTWRNPEYLWMICAAVPSVLFFVLLSFIKPVIASWPLPSLAPLVVLVGAMAAEQPWRESKNSFHGVWNAMVVYGIIGTLLLAFPNVLAINAHFRKSLLDRITGHREEAARIAKLLSEIHTPDGAPALLVTRHYMKACLLSFYMPDHPTVRTAAKYLGKRSTTFDQWTDTKMDNPELYGRTLLLIGDGDVPWEQAIRFDTTQPTSRKHCWLAPNYRGPQPNHPSPDGQASEEP